MRLTGTILVLMLLSCSLNVSSQRTGSYITLKNLGCWKDGFYKHIPSLEGRSRYLDGSHRSRVDAVQKCARAAIQRGYRVFGLQDGGLCTSSSNAPAKYSRLGKAGNCGNDGKGAFRANQVYEVVGTISRGAAPVRSRVQPGFVFENGRRQGTRVATNEDDNSGAHEFILNDIGCWPLPSSGVQSMEGLLDELDGHYKYRRQAVTKCAKGLSDLGYEVMALHDSGKCLAIDNIKAIVEANPSRTRRKRCSNTGKGTQSSIQVYEIRYSKTRFLPSPLPTTTTTTPSTTMATTTPIAPIVTSPTPPWVVSPEYVEYTPSWSRWTVRTTRRTIPIWTAKRTSPPPPVFTTRRRTTTQPSTTAVTNNYQEYFQLVDLGCWKYAWNNTLPTLEGSSRHLDGHYSLRIDAIRKCAKVASSFGYEVFAVQDGGRCVSARNARERYTNLGRSSYCREDGKGGSWVNQIYEVNVIWDVKINGLGCYAAGSSNPISSLEGTSELLDLEHFRRKDPIRKCARLAALRGFSVFALHDDGECMSDENARETYSVNGGSTSCPRHGRGGFGANEVYEVIEATKLKLRNLGCWKDSRSRAVPGMEQTDGDLMDNYELRKDAIGKCARVAHRNGFKIFVIQDGGWCGGSRQARTTYARYGISTACKADGEGGFEAIQVFEILEE